MYRFWKRKKNVKEINLDIAAEKNMDITAAEFRYLIHSTERDVVFLCIGSDRFIVDCLGPLVGTMLQENKGLYHVYGTLKNPVHALNLKSTLKEINKQFQNPFLVAIDACVSERNHVGEIFIKKGPLFPGRAMNKKLDEVGDCHIKAIVNYIDKYESNHFLASTRLHTVMDMAKKVYELITDNHKEGQKRVIKQKD
ncbi:spore protease YyaC [Domibacillus robiginosus]|uniref:spore protease YyaC n=1 Tax=Domibacillus robiginosus TaxID=1071054 RepID=UPI0009E43288|nr:spore protease YyaC [Domibacillus robiginosus]